MTATSVALPRVEITDPSAVRSFLSVLRRDIVVTGRELPIFLQFEGRDNVCNWRLY
jgi:hypothetical protein